MPEEDDILRRYYLTEGWNASRWLPNKSEAACMERAYMLGIQKIEKRKHWTPEEDAILRKYYPLEGADTFKRFPGRTPSACTSRAKKIGVIRDKISWTKEEHDLSLIHIL